MHLRNIFMRLKIIILLFFCFVCSLSLSFYSRITYDDDENYINEKSVQTIFSFIFLLLGARKSMLFHCSISIWYAQLHKQQNVKLFIII